MFIGFTFICRQNCSHTKGGFPMPRKGENIYKRKDGRWEGRYIKSRTPDGKTHYCADLMIFN